MAVCNRCGLCCWYYLDGRLTKCKYLVQLRNNRTACRVHGYHVGIEIINGHLCQAEPSFNYPNCPFNSPEKPFFSRFHAADV
jgi:hypothetical protein